MMDEEQNTVRTSASLDGNTDLDIPAGEARFIVEGGGYQINVKIKAAAALVHGVARTFFDGENPEPRTAMLLDYHHQKVSIYPQLIAFNSRLYKQKYRRIREIQFDYDLDGRLAEDHYDIVEIVSGLPNGFLRDPAFGLGVVKEMRPLIQSIERIEGVSRLVITGQGTTRVEQNTFFFNDDDYRLLQQGMSRTTRTYQTESLTDRQLMAHNASVHRALPERFPHKERPYKPGTVFKLLGGTQSSLVTLKGKDRLGVLQAVTTNAQAIADRDPKEFVQLQNDIEIVSLDRLIASTVRHIHQNSNEGAWQSLLELNPFLLTMLFGQPIVILAFIPLAYGD